LSIHFSTSAIAVYEFKAVSIAQLFDNAIGKQTYLGHVLVENFIGIVLGRVIVRVLCGVEK